MVKRGHWQPTTGREFARTGLRHRIESRFGTPMSLEPTSEVAAMVVMAHPKRERAWSALVEEFKAFGAVAVVDNGGGIMANAERVLQTLIARAAEHTAQEPAPWCIVMEDDIVPSQGLAQHLGAVLASVPEGAAACSLHSDVPTVGRGWRYRQRGEVLRTQFICWRLPVLKWVLEELQEYRRCYPTRHGWDTACSNFLDRCTLQAAISVPSYVQHDTRKHQSLLGHVTRKAPNYSVVMK